MVLIRSPIAFTAIVALLALGLAAPPAVSAVCPAGQVNAQPDGECIIDGASVPKYEIPLVIPPVMDDVAPPNRRQDNRYQIAVRQFQQQILPGGIWNFLGATTETYPPTTVWSYGPNTDMLPDSSAIGGGAGIAPAPNSQFNYPAYTVETMSNVPVWVRWINDLKSNFGRGQDCLPHLLPIDQTLHWANPPGGPGGTDTHGMSQDPYTGPVPIVTHVHGAHVDPHSDGYPEAWWLPNCRIPKGYATEGTLFDDARGQRRGLNRGFADYYYRQDQPATTLWYHDHALGMTRNNVYAGPAGFWFVRGGDYDMVDDSTTGDLWDGVLPGPAPAPGEGVLDVNLTDRAKYREIPIVIQDRSFKPNGDLFYPDNRAFFEGLAESDLDINFAPISDVAPIWNPEAFFNMMVVNGVVWPQFEVADSRYRFRFLNGCNSRFLILRLVTVDDEDDITDRANWNTVPGAFWQIGAEQGFLPAPVQLTTLLMGLAERADVIVDFGAIAVPEGHSLYLVNDGPDEPFGGLPVDVPADAATTGQVMKFVVNTTLNGESPTDSTATDPVNLTLNAEPALGALTNPTPRLVSLNEEMSGDMDPAKRVCVCADDDEEFAIPIVQKACAADPADVCPGGFQNLVSFGPVAAKLGTVNGSGIGATGNPLLWTDDAGVTKVVTLQSGATLNVNVTENPALNAIEHWDIYNFTVDAHPIHLHLVRFEVVERTIISEDSPNYVEGPPNNIGTTRGPEGWETGFKDTVIAYPGEITRVKSHFDIEGLYVWHCHIVEHEDNEMMRPYAVGLPNAPPPAAPAAEPIPMGFGGVL